MAKAINGNVNVVRVSDKQFSQWLGMNLHTTSNYSNKMKKFSNEKRKQSFTLVELNFLITRDESMVMKLFCSQVSKKIDNILEIHSQIIF